MNVSAPMTFLGKQMQFLDVWRPYIKEALAGGSQPRNFDDIARMILDNIAFIADIGTGCFIVFEILQYPRHKVLHGAVAGGDLSALHGLEPMAHEIARAAGCKYLGVAGREGWARHLKKDGWKHDYVTLYKEVEP